MAIAQGQVHQHSFKMMGDGLDRPQSALLRGVQITEFKDSRVNPQPIILEESDVLLEEYLSPRKLKLLTGVDNLENVCSLEMRVDTSDTSLGNFGAMLPNLSQLKLSNSLIRSIRDVGSSLRCLRVLWMSRCGLQELDGLSSMSRLTELYLSYNEIADLSPISMLENLQILDLEGNNIEDISQIQYLEMCLSLESLTLEANPICLMSSPDSQELNYDYRGTIRTILPQLQSLDDESISNSESSKKTNVFDEDWAFLDELQKDLGLQNLNTENLEEDNKASVPAVRPSSGKRTLANYRPGSALRPGTGMRPLTRQGSPSARPKTSNSPNSSGGRPATAARPPSTEENEIAESASSLTKGGVICGNPCRALRNRRGDSFTPPGNETAPKLFAQYRHKPEHTYDPVPADITNNEEFLSELKEWRVHHDELIKKITAEKAPQVLTIVPDEIHDLSDSDAASESDEEDVNTDSNTVSVSTRPEQRPMSRESVEVKPPRHRPSGHGRPRTPEFRSRQYRTDRNLSPSDAPSNSPVRTRRHDESFEEDASPERSGYRISQLERSLGGVHPVIASKPTVPSIPRQSPLDRNLSPSDAPSNSPVRTRRHDESFEEDASPERSGYRISQLERSLGGVHPVIASKPTVPSIPRQSPLDRHPINEPLRAGLTHSPESTSKLGAASLPPRASTSRAALALPSQLRIKRQLPNVPSERSREAH